MAKGKTGPSTALAEKRDAAIEKAGGNETLLEHVAAGLSWKEVAAAVGLEPTEVNAGAIRRRLSRQAPDELEEAKRASVDAIAERATEMYGTEAPTNSADAKWRNDRAGHLRWIADLRGGRDKGGNVYNIGQLHLDALRAAGRRIPDAGRELMGRPADQILEAEVIEDGDE
jgi:hypothetical protein